jgi:putative SOS response-associated peptidase YedK
MVTVPANQLIATLPTDRIPAILDDADWALWLCGTTDEALTCLKTVEGAVDDVERGKGGDKAKRPTVTDPTGLF